MHDYLFTTEVVRFAFMFGVAVSMLLYERRHLTTGSIVVPGYIATFIAMPLTLLATFLNAFVSYWVVNKVLRRWFLLYGRTKFTVLASISILIQTLMLKFSPVGSWLWENDFKLLVGVGYVVPALIAHDMGRQGIKKTIKAVSLAGLIVAAPIALALAVRLPGINDLAPLRGGFDSAIDVGWIPIGVLLSAAAAWGVARNLNLRSGGFMGAAFLAILIGDPWQVAVVAGVSTLTYLIVTRLLMNSMILFGRRKFSSMLLVSASFSWALLWVGGELFGVGVQSHMDLGSLALTPLIVPGLLANDAQRTSPLRVGAGAALATTFVLSMTWTIQSAVENRHLDLGWKLLAVLTTALIFGRPVHATVRARVRRRRDVEVVVDTPVAVPEPVSLPEPVSIPEPVIVPVPVAVGADNSPAFGGYQVWAALHREAADAAERWLSSIVGERPALVTATVAAAPVSAVRTPAEHNSESRTLDRLRAAAVSALATQSRAPRQSAPLPVRQKALPIRRRASDHRSELEAVTARVAGLSGRHVLSTRRSAEPLPPANPPGAPVVLPPDRSEISERPDAATRAHTAASGARTTPTPQRKEPRHEGEYHVFPG